MGMRMLPFFKSKKGWQFAGGGNIDEYGDLPIATENSPGCVKPDGTTTTVSSAGALSAKTATGSAAGIVKPDGSTITIEDGVISAATATGSAAGIVKPDGETIEINDGEISTTALLQKEELPTASEDELGKRYLYTGATGSGLVNGYVYKCVSDGGDPATYSWVAVDVQSIPTANSSTYGTIRSGMFGCVSSSATYTDCNDIAIGEFVEGAVSAFQNMDNIPINNFYGNIYCLRVYYIYKIQFAFYVHDGSMYYRAMSTGSSGGWTAWKKVTMA